MNKSKNYSFLPSPCSPNPLTSWLFVKGDLNKWECKFFEVWRCWNLIVFPHKISFPASQCGKPWPSFNIHKLPWSSFAPCVVTDCCPLPEP